MEIIKGDMFKSSADYVFVTTNATIKKNGAVVMGRGAARQLRDLKPGIDLLFGGLIKNIQDDKRRYGVGWELSDTSPKYGIFQVKYDWWDDADLDLIRYSTELLLDNVEAGVLSGYQIALNFPGIGNGRLNINDVYPTIKELPDNVYVFIKE